MPINSIASAFSSISRVAKQQLTPSSKLKRESTRRQHARDDSASSSVSSFSSGSNISYGSGSEVSSYEDGRSHSRSKQRESRQSSNRRSSRRKQRNKSTDGRHRQQNSISRNDAEQMVDLLSRLLPFYGTGDQNSDALVIDTIHRLPPHALEVHDSYGTTLLLLVCQFGAYDLLTTLIAKGCNVNASNNAGATSLHFSCFSDTFSAESAIALVRHGAVAEVVESDWGCTPLHWAAFAGHVELCRVLCIAGANPATRDKCGNDPIAYSKQSGNPACTAILESFRRDGKGDTVNLGWEKIIDRTTGSSFYHNKGSGESLWGDTFRALEKIESLPDNSVNAGSVPEYSALKSLSVNERSPCAADDHRINAQKNDRTDEVEPFSLVVSVGSNESRTSEQKHSTPERRIASTFQSSLVDIVEVESIGSDSSEDIKPIQHTFETDDIQNTKQLENSQEIDLETKRGLVPEQCLRLDSDTLLFASNNRLQQAETDDIIHILEKEEGLISNNDDGPEGNRGKPSSVILNAARHTSIEHRIFGMHEKMESQLMGRLQLLEEKIDRQKSDKTNDELFHLKQQLLEKSTATLQLRSDIADRDLEILSFKQTILSLEYSLESLRKGSETSEACFGLGELNPDMLIINDAKVLTEKDRLEHELKDAMKKIEQLQKEYQQAIDMLASAEEQRKIAEVSLSSMTTLLEKERDRSDVPILSQTSAEENNQPKYGGLSVKQEFCAFEASAQNELKLMRHQLENTENEVNVARAQRAQIENDLKNSIASLVELKSLHENEISELVKSHKTVLREVQNQLKKEQLSKLDLEVSKGEAVVEMKRALEMSLASETRLKGMMAKINETEALKQTNDELHSSLQKETEMRKTLHNTLEDMKGRIRVYVRIRPLSKTEMNAGYVNIITKENERTVVMASEPATSAESKEWEFDKIFNGSDDDGNTQEAIFKDTSLLIQSAIDGFNVVSVYALSTFLPTLLAIIPQLEWLVYLKCIFAYGQTGSGKTYTMFGGHDEIHKGLAPRVAFELFTNLKERESSYYFEVSVSMLELYTDKLRDLLVQKTTTDDDVPDLKLHLADHTASGLVEVEGAILEKVVDGNALLDVFNRGAKCRASATTKMNADSSRSHMIATVILKIRNKRTGGVVNGKLTLVDLAGSERVGKSGAEGLQLKEAQSINTSLSALGDVIGALTTGGRQHIPYRNHPLTMLMSDSIGGNAKTLMFVCCSPADYNRKETTNSLDFAKRIRNVTNNVNVSAKSSTGGTSIRSSASSNVNQIRALRAELLMKEKGKGKEVSIKSRSTLRGL